MKIGLNAPKGSRIVFQPSIFRGYWSVSFQEGIHSPKSSLRAPTWNLRFCRRLRIERAGWTLQMQDATNHNEDDQVLSVRSEYPQISILYPQTTWESSDGLFLILLHGYLPQTWLFLTFTTHPSFCNSQPPSPVDAFLKSVEKKTSLLKHLPGNQGLAEHDETIWTTCHHLNVSCFLRNRTSLLNQTKELELP